MRGGVYQIRGGEIMREEEKEVEGGDDLGREATFPWSRALTHPPSWIRCHYLECVTSLAQNRPVYYYRRLKIKEEKSNFRFSVFVLLLVQNTGQRIKYPQK